MARRDPPVTGKARNWVAAANPLLRKGGVHQKSRKTERQTARMELRRASRRDSDPAQAPLH